MGRLVKLLVLPVCLLGLPLALYYFLPSRADHLAAAHAALDRRDFPAARRELDAHLARSPTDADALLLAARTARRADDPAAADEYLRRFLDAGGTAEEAALEREMQRSQAGEVANAGAVMKFCTDHPDEPTVPYMLEALVRGLMRTGQLRTAFAAVDAWLARPLPPGDKDQGLFWRGQILEAVNRHAEAAAEYRKVLDLDPDHAEARFRLAEYLRTNDPPAALPLLQGLDGATPGRFEVRFALAQCRRQLGDLKEADALLAPLLAERPDDPAVLTEAGALALDRGQPAAAEPLLRKAVARDPNEREAHIQLARCLEETARPAEAREHRDRATKIEEDRKRQLDALGR